MSGVPLCPWQNVAASKQNQNPYHIWSSTPYTSSNCTDSGAAYYTRYLDGTTCARSGLCATTRADNYAGYTHFGSVRFSFGFRMILFAVKHTPPYCPNQGAGASKQWQGPSYIWSSTPYTRSDCSGQSAYYAYNLGGTSWSANSFCAVLRVAQPGEGEANTHTHFGSVRCGFRMHYPKRRTARRMQLFQRERCTALSRPAPECKQAESRSFSHVVFYTLYLR